MPKIGCSNTLKIENLQNVQNPEGYPQKENRQRTVRSSACCSIYFRNRNRIVRSRFRLLSFCYGSNSGVGSYTSIISRAANRNPIVNACSSCLSEISASAFFKLFEQSLLLFCERGSELRFEPHNGYKRSAFICAGCYTLYCFFKE